MCLVILLLLQQPDSLAKTAKANHPSPKRPSSYKTDILPLLTSNCNPCHFPGGKVHDEYPFDSYKTVFSLGLKLNTRLKGKEKEIIEQWVKTGKIENSPASK